MIGLRRLWYRRRVEIAPGVHPGSAPAVSDTVEHQSAAPSVATNPRRSVTEVVALRLRYFTETLREFRVRRTGRLTGAEADRPYVAAASADEMLAAISENVDGECAERYRRAAQSGSASRALDDRD